ncbi:MAG: YjjG family noncanonical pyrimidine nucleotidase [Lachnospiraceae bacterium]|nr:YjjG family noncanonical pyrimidine nucleotidase [Lachnospiraceae bacterium]
MTRKIAKTYGILLLDVDGTLLDFNESERQGISRVLTRYGFPASEELLSRYHDVNEQFWQAFGRGELTKQELLDTRFTIFFRMLGKDVDGPEAEGIYREFLDGSAILIPGALETCRYLSGKYDCYVVTNGTSDTQYKRLALSGLDRYMKDVFVSEDTGSQKPQKEYFEYCFSRIFPECPEIGEAEKRQILIVGDSLHSDMLGGNYAGIDTCWVNPEGLAAGEVHIDYEIQNVAELQKLL